VNIIYRKGVKMVVSIVSAIESPIFISSIGIASLLTFMVMLITKELATTGNSKFCLNISMFSRVAILPLFLAFAVAVIVKIIEII